MHKCRYACSHEAKYTTSYLRGNIPLYGLDLCEEHINELISEHNDDTSTVQILVIQPIEEVRTTGSAT